MFTAAAFLAATGDRMLEDERPPTGTGVADAGTIGEELHARDSGYN